MASTTAPDQLTLRSTILPSIGVEGRSSLKLSEGAELVFKDEIRQFQLNIPEKHIGTGSFDGNTGLGADSESAATAATAPPTPGPLPAYGTFYYDSWDDVLRVADLRFSVSSEANFNIAIVFEAEGKKVAEYKGESDGIRGGAGSFEWSK